MKLPPVRTSTLAVIAILATGAVTVTAAGADGSKTSAFTVEGSGEIPPISLELTEDILAATGREAVAPSDSLIWQNEFAMVVMELQDAFPDYYANSGIDDAADSAWVSFAADAPRGAVELIQSLPIDVTVNTNVGWTETEMLTLGEGLHYDLLAEPGAADNVHTSIDTQSGKIDVYAEAPGGELTHRTQRALDGKSAELSSEHARAAGVDLEEAGISIQFHVVSNLEDGNDAIYGGGRVTGSGQVCTTGFSVRQASYANGMMTADHCPNGLSYGGYTLTFRGSHSGSAGDFQWNSATTTSHPRFYVSSGTLRTITASANPVNGATYCKYGVRTANTCDRVYMLNQCRGSYCGQAMMFNRRADGGDSGGPWFWNTTGYGIHSGYKTHGGYARDMFSPLQRGANALGVTVKLG